MNQRDVWSSGDWEATSVMIAEAGPRLVERAGVAPGMRVLDVGTGNGTAVAIPAARIGAAVVASDLTDEWFAQGRRHAEAAGVEVEWVEADVETLPFADRSFDRVLSTFGHIFAPHHAEAAAQMARVTAPRGLVAATAWTADGFGSTLLRRLAAYGPPPPPGAQPPPLWGDLSHIEAMFAPHGLGDITVEHETLCIWEGPLEGLVALYESSFGPAVTLRATLDPERWAEARAELEATIREFADRRPDQTIRLDAGYVVMLAVR